jgi:hypothetical protein
LIFNIFIPLGLDGPSTRSSCETRHLDKNLSGIFTIWDRLAGTLYLPREDETPPLGLQQEEHREYNSVFRLYVLPFAKIVRRVDMAIRTGKKA